MSEARQGSVGASPLLQDVLACILGVSNAKPAITARIEKHGGRVAARLSNQVSHIVWERRHSRRPSDKAADEAELLELFYKLEKMEYPPVVVSPLWVEESIKAGRRLVERKYLVKKPTESLLGRTPGAGSASAAKKRKRPAAAAMPKPAEAYELDDLHFSSTQQMQGNAAGPAAAAAGDPEGTSLRDGKQPRCGGGVARGAKQPQQGGGGGRRAVGDGMPTVIELLAEEEDDQLQQPSGVNIGTNTQAVANILTIDLPDGSDHGGTPGGSCGAVEEDEDEEQDELNTPLALRLARSSVERAAGWGTGSSGDRCRRAAPAPLPGAAAVGAVDKRSRLALASGPAEAAEERAMVEVGEVEEMQVDETPAEKELEQPAEQQADDDNLAAKELEQPETEEQAEQAFKAAAAAKRVAVARFSVRQLVQHPERLVVVHKGTPLSGSLPSLPADEQPAAYPIPVPVVERVANPWALAEQMPTQTPASQLEGAGPAGRAETTGCPSIGQPRTGGRRSLLGVSNMRLSSGAGATPSSAAQPPAADGDEGKLPTPWSTLRPWDGKAAQQQQQKQGVGRGNENENQPQQQVSQAGQAKAQPAGGYKASAAATEPSLSAAGSSSAPGPNHGCIALTSVDGAVVELAQSATRRLRGLRMCPEGREEGLITHLVIGDERRTLKLMLAVANGSWLLSPQWVTASLEAGQWLPESLFPARVRFEAAAERARSLLEVPDVPPLLHDHSIYIHVPDKARKLMATNATALKRVAGVLGAKVVPPKSCNVCVVVGGGVRPPHIPWKAQCVQEEWLLQAAERFEVPPLKEYHLWRLPS